MTGQAVPGAPGNDADAWGGYRQTCFEHRETPNVAINLPP